MHERRYNASVERLRSPQRVNLLEVDRVVKSALDGIQVQSVLDIGTGSGIFAEAFAQKNISVTGIDPNPDMLKAAQEYVPQGTFLHGIIEEIPLHDKTFDLVFLGHVLHESDDLHKALRETKRCAQKRVVILEWPYRPDESGPPLEHRLKTDDVVTAALQVGFSRIEPIQLQHMILFRCDV